MTNRRSKSMLFLFCMQNAKMQLRNTGPYALQNRQICAFPTGEASRAGTQQNQPLTLCPANNISKKLHQKG